MKISVITVVYNAVADIEKTILSVMQQRYNDYEYIVVDGASTDGTVDVIRRYENSITQWISEPDKGIYNAMNKAVCMAKGEYCIFMNAGDGFANQLVLKAVSLFLSDDFDVLTGCEYSTKNGKIIDYVKPQAQVTLKHLYISSISHQSSFIRRSLLLEYPYDENLRLVSDWKFWIQTLALGGKNYRAIDVDVSLFNHDGITFSQKEQGMKERQQVLFELIPNSLDSNYIVLNKTGCFFVTKLQICNRLYKKVKIDRLKHKIKSVANYFTVLGTQAIMVIVGKILVSIKIDRGRSIIHNTIMKYLDRNYSEIIDEDRVFLLSDNLFKDSFPIWVCWWQGERMMPLIPKLCLKKLKQNKRSDQQVIVISEDNYRDYIDLPQYIIDLLNYGKISITNFSDVLRYALLSKYGGLWIDSTCYTTSELPNLKDILYYTTKQRKYGDDTYISRYRWGSYLMGGMPNQIFVNERNLFFEYLKKERCFVDYLLLDYFLNLIYIRSETCSETMDNCLYHNENILEMAGKLNGVYNDALWNDILVMDTIHKLSWKLKYNMYDKNTGDMTVFGKIIDLA